MPSSSSSPRQPVILGFDPGRAKCGLAVVGLDRSLFYHDVVPAKNAVAKIAALCEQYPVSLLVMGDQTSSKEWQQTLTYELAQIPRIVLVDERYSTLEARDRYWQIYRPQGLSRFLPQSLRTIPRPIDDIVAILLVERYLQQLTATPYE